MKPPIYNDFGGKDDRDDIIPAFTVQASADEFSAQIVRNMKALGLTSAEIVFLDYLMSHGFSWSADCRVSPSLKEMHRVTGLATGTIHDARRGLIEKGFIKVIDGRNKQRTNTYTLLPLREKLYEIAWRKMPATPETTVDEGKVPQNP